MIGDVVGKTGRAAIHAHLPGLRETLALDFVIVNAENAAHGFGITSKICAELYASGADVITTGNHIWDQRDIMNYIASDPKLLRPVNYPEGTPGAGFGVYETAAGQKILVANAMASLFMNPLDDPFVAVEKVFSKYKLGVNIQAAVLDFHGEASSEKQGMGHYLDGRVSAVVGTHTHVPTSDYRVLAGGTAYQTDLGMTGDYDSVIGMKKKTATGRFLSKLPQGRLEPAEQEATLCGLFVQTNDVSGLAIRARPVRVGGELDQALPSLN